MRLVIILVVISISFSGCHQSDPIKRDEYGMLAGQWNLWHASVDGRDVTNSFENLQLTIYPDKSFTVTNSKPHLWPASGRFTLRNDDSFQLLRDDGIYLQIEELSSSTLKVFFVYVTPAGRTSSIAGRYTFEFHR